MPKPAAKRKASAPAAPARRQPPPQPPPQPSPQPPVAEPFHAMNLFNFKAEPPEGFAQQFSLGGCRMVANATDPRQLQGGNAKFSLSPPPPLAPAAGTTGMGRDERV